MHPEEEATDKVYSLGLLSDVCVYSNNNHAAFTSLTDYRGDTIIAFREGASHRPTFKEDYGHISIIYENKGRWEKIAELSHPDMDLRDPFFIKIGETLRMYCGYNQFVDDGRYQHSGTVYSNLTETGWSDFMPIVHEVPHIIWLWKIRKYNDILYGVGYLEGEKPVLLSSSDGIEWKTEAEFQVEGILSEADMVFSGDSMYVCLRQDSPTGSPSHWGKSEYPFRNFEWNVMNVSVASPELLIHPESHQIYLAGRIYDYKNKPQKILVSLLEVSTSGETKEIYTFDTGEWGDKGYPSMMLNDKIILLSYYFGMDNTSVHLSKFDLMKRDE